MWLLRPSHERSEGHSAALFGVIGSYSPARIFAPAGKLVTYRRIIKRRSTTWFVQPAWKARSAARQMKKFPRKGGDRSGKQDRRQPGLSREPVVLYEDDAVVALNKP